MRDAMMTPFPSSRPASRLLRAGLLVAGLGTAVALLSACPGHQLVPANPGTQVSENAFQLDTPVQVLAPSLRTVSAFRIAGFHVLSDPAISFDTPVPGAEVRAIPTTGGLTVIGTTDASGRVTMRLDLNKVYTIVASFKDVDGKPRTFRTFAKVTEADKAAPPTQPLDFASTLVAEAIAKGRDKDSLPSLDVSKVKDAVKSTLDVLKAKPEAFTAIIMETDTANTDAVSKALQAISLVKQLDPALAAMPDPIDALSTAQSSVDPTNSHAAGGTPSANPPVTPPAPPVVAPVVTKPPTTIQRFELVDGPDTIYLPFANGAQDAAYPQSRLLKARTVLSNGTELPIANWTIVSGGQGGKISLEGGLVRASAGAIAGEVVIRASALSDASLAAQRTVRVAETPRRVLSVSLALPASIPALTVPADGAYWEDNNLDRPTEAQLAWELTWNDRARTGAPDDATLLEWKSLTPGMVTVDAWGLVSAKPGSSEGTASVEVKTRTEPPVTTVIPIPVRREGAIRVDIK